MRILRRRWPRQTGIDQVKAHVSPLEKAAAVRELQAAGQKVLMAGDGINDAPALVQADVGVAMGRATDIALESADIVIMRPDLRLVPLALALSQKNADHHPAEHLLGVFL